MVPWIADGRYATPVEFNCHLCFLALSVIFLIQILNPATNRLTRNKWGSRCANEDGIVLQTMEALRHGLGCNYGSLGSRN